MKPLLALSVRQPWAHAIVHLGKDLENRSARYGHRGLTLIHASAGMTPEEYGKAREFMQARGLISDGGLPYRQVMERGGIIGAVEIIDAVDQHPSPWWMGPRALVLKGARPIPFIPCKGTVTPMFWTPPEGVAAQARRALGL